MTAYGGPLVTHARVDLLSIATILERRWGADANGRMPCPVPGHVGGAYVNTTADDPAGDLRLLCCRGRWRSLGEVRAAQAYGADDRPRSNVELLTWTRRLAFECGALAPLAVPLPPLPPDSTPMLGSARDGFALLAGLRWMDRAPGPVAFSIRFCAAWSGLTFREANLSLAELRNRGIIRQAGRVGRVLLYVPGEVR